ncbi:helix-turn-helix domain-containing protein [Marilutibacter spongiae]|uniref:Helix-turn-helix transcriptional regulator n=1 Tax=Marilutibacter spongiae TaxID=2025720 RepID=A0A7W3TMP4_9GAMM|nr:helix-turn-helix transcriptional regulator [Lysobacter spongiae]
MSALSLRVRKARVMATLSQAELARRIGVKRSAVTQWEQAAGTTPSVEHLIKLALETGVNFEWLASGRGPSRCDEVEADPAVIVDDFARDADESQALTQFRRLSPSRRRMALGILEILGK